MGKSEVSELLTHEFTASYRIYKLSLLDATRKVFLSKKSKSLLPNTAIIPVFGGFRGLKADVEDDTLLCSNEKHPRHLGVCNQQVVGSNPSAGSLPKKEPVHIPGALALPSNETPSLLQ